MHEFDAPLEVCNVRRVKKYTANLDSKIQGTMIIATLEFDGQSKDNKKSVTDFKVGTCLKYSLGNRLIPKRFIDLLPK